MPTPDESPRADGLPSEAWQRVEVVLRSFEDSWRRGGRPRLGDYLPASGPERRVLLAELAHEDLDYRLQAGEAARVEDYLAGYPELAADREAVLALLASEYELRRRREPGCAAAEYLQRFPQYAAELPARLAAPGPCRNAPGPSPVSTLGDDAQAATPRPGARAAAGPAPGWPSVPGYDILGELGRGAIGVVYKAIQTDLKRVVALKMILAGPHAAPDVIARFRNEAEAIARLQHPNIVQIYGISSHNGLPYYSFEFCPNGTLASRLKGAPMPEREAARLTATLAWAMFAVHKQGIVHRDLKPSNILLADNAVPKIADFGLAKQTDVVSLTGTSAVLGTPPLHVPRASLRQEPWCGPGCRRLCPRRHPL
jgi:hypothetical protein